MRLGSRQFSPRLWAVLSYLAVLSCMLWLGNWQLNRAALKVTLQASAQAAQQADAVPIQSVTDWEEAAAVYQRVSVQGRYDDQHQLLWDNRTFKGQAGFEVITPLVLADGSQVLVNRGWIAPGESRQDLPDVSLPEGAEDALVAIEGVLSRPSKGFASGDAVPADGSWPRLLQYFDYAQIGQRLGAPVLPVVVQAQALSTDARQATVFSQRPEWLEANWQPAASGPAKHYSYAFQWFAMATALSVIFVALNTRKTALATDSSV